MVVNDKQELVYISRSLIPGSKKKIKSLQYLKQVCIYAFNINELNKFASKNKKGELENTEDIEILRFFDHNIKVKMAEGFVSTPMVSLGVVKESASLGIVITASHNPPTYNGYKLKGDFGGPLLPENVSEVENLIPENNNVDLDNINFQSIVDSGMVEIIDLGIDICQTIVSWFI